MNKKNLILTFDYELFLGGRSGTVENCLIRPTVHILEILKKHSCKGIFFVDLTYLLRLSEIEEKYPCASSDFEKIKIQLKEMAKEGHQIYWHIHPHWLDAIYLPSINQWDLSKKEKFSIDNLSNYEIDTIFHKSFELLKEVNLNGQAKGYRAGGLYVQPFTKLQPFFIKYDIKYDFSVLKAAKSNDLQNGFSFDYSNCPLPPIYRFNDDVTVSDNSGKFVEISMELIELKNVRKILNGIYYRLTKNSSSFNSYGDGKSSGNVIGNGKKMKKRYFYTKETISIELMNPIRTKMYLSLLNKKELVHFISHPKSLSKHSVEQFDLFLTKAKKRFIIQTDIERIVETKIGKVNG